MDLYAELVKSNMVDAIVATGATIVDMDFFEALGHKHYQANEIPDDDTLRSLYIDRIYDTYIDEQQLQDCDITIGKIADSLEPRPYSQPRLHPRDGQVAERGQRARRTAASSSSPTSMTCRSSARRSSTARPASASSSTRSTR